MFSSILDTVRLADQKQLTLVEAYLMRSALSGNPAVLSPNQAIDSAAVQAIVAGNKKDHANHFIRAVEKGIIRISLPGGTRSLLDHCLNTISRSRENKDSEFIFSSLGFLYAEENGECVYDYDFRKSVLDYIYNKLSTSRYRNHAAVAFPVTLPPSERDRVELYIEVISELDKAIRVYDQYNYLKELYPHMVRQALNAKLQVTPPDTALAEFIKLVLKASEEPNISQYRSYYYRLCNQYTPTFGIEAIIEVREILDICYNKLIAISINEPAEINISPNLAETVALQTSEDDTVQTLLASSRTVADNVQKLDWELLIEIYEEVEAICRQKGLTWQAALELFHSRQSSLPFMLGGKYALITSLTMAISSIPIVGPWLDHAVAEVLINALFGEIETHLKKPSLLEIRQESKKASQKVQMMDFIICTNKVNRRK